MQKKIIEVFMILILIFLIFPINSKAAKDLDEIEDYTITIDMKKDGSMDMKYHVEWKVLDSSSEGPLEWVKIGVANKYVSNIKSLSDNIKKIKYTYDGGNYIRIDFKKKYYAGEIVTFDYSLNQSYMYTIKSDGTCTYSFTPGWFDDINVKRAVVKWNRNNVNTYTQGAEIENGYLVWSKSLYKGQKMKVDVTFNRNAFELDVNKQATNVKKTSDKGVWLLIIIFVGYFILMIPALRGGAYNRHSGFGGGHYYGGGCVHSSCAHSSCACASCACACACAGGGRAGCSKKDFYGTNLKTDNIKNMIKSEK